MIGCSEREAWATLHQGAHFWRGDRGSFAVITYLIEIRTSASYSSAFTRLLCDAGKNTTILITQPIVHTERHDTLHIMSASNARGHYANPPLEDEDDLIDPDDGKRSHTGSLLLLEHAELYSLLRGN